MNIKRTQISTLPLASRPQYSRQNPVAPTVDRFEPSKKGQMLPGVVSELTGSGSSLLGKSLVLGTALAAVSGAFLGGQGTGIGSGLVGAAAGLAGGATIGGLLALGLADKGKIPVQLVPVAASGSILLGAASAGIGAGVTSYLAGGPAVGAGLTLLALPGALVAGKILERRCIAD